MSALVWSVESLLLALWALGLASINPNPLHLFVARSHALFSGFTLAVHLFISARLLSVEHAVSEAFACAVSSLFVLYITVLFDPHNYSDPRLFSYSIVSDFLPFDAWVGIGWFAAALISALGMALSERGRASWLMFHPFGYHMLIVPPSFLVFWLYSYSPSGSESLSATLLGARVTHALYSGVLLGLWGVFIILQAMGESIPIFAYWPEGDSRRILTWILRFAGRGACVLIAVSALFVVHTNTQVALVWTLIGIGIANAVDWTHILDWMLGSPNQSSLPPSLEAKMRQDPAALALHIKEI